MHILTHSLTNSKYSTYLIFISTKFLALFSFTCSSSCPLLFHLFSFLTLIVINISPGKNTTYIFILTNILFLFGYRVLKFGMTFLSHFVIHLLFLVANINYYYRVNWGCRDGAVVRALASHQCGPGSIPGLGVICGLSLLVLYSAPRGFLRVLRFPLFSKTNI